jgi:DNA repair exonuclease SbcCD nuclease subunit
MKKKRGLVFLADFHIGAMSDLGVGKDGVNIRDLDKIGIAQGVSAFCEDHGVYGVVICGDIYHYPNPKTTDRKVAAKIIRSLSRTCPVHIIPGNHDFGKDGCSLIEGLYEISDVTVIDTPRVVGVGNNEIVCIPFSQKKKFEEEFAEIMEVYSGKNGVLVGHVSAFGSVSSTDFEMRGAEDVDFTRMKSSKIGLCVLGHIHKHQEIHGANYPVLYPGSLVRLSFGERKDTKGFLHVSDDLNWHFYPYMDRQVRMYHVGVNEDGKFLIPSNWGNKLFDGAIIRVILSGSREALATYGGSFESFAKESFPECASVHVVRSVAIGDERVRSKKLAKMATHGINLESAVREYTQISAPEKTRKFTLKIGKKIIRGEKVSEEI